MTKYGKKIRQVKENIDLTKKYTLQEALELLQKNKTAKFDETLDVVVKVGVDPTNSEQGVRGVASMPSGTGKNVRVAVITSDKYEDKASKAGADVVGLANVIEDIKAGKIDFDICIATPDVMPQLSSIARILGPKGLMPNPKLGTLTTDVEAAVSRAKAGQVEFRSDKGALIHAGVGKLSFTLDALVVNVRELIQAIIKAKPAGSKGTYLNYVCVSSTMGVGVKVDIGSIG
jgi:large subunit ribosomal protein L1